ncbi:MAG: aminomethyl-transferring glycine dehydrogenase subunit GcvPB [Eubacteriales bacterium]|nr:aminomethyl-transferring glycine dehydrogenase subunit GcvPB [Eubacteriales bacterium]MDD4540774.1 aminomethyl-transferring glycine dehydrogenase subunit GcvPB [Eubacteriales bacterium]
MTMLKETPLIFTLGSKSFKSSYIRPLDVEMPDLAAYYGDSYRAEMPDIPNVDEITAVRHFTNMSNKNFSVEVGTYPLGSCTMKYNPKVNEDMAALPGFANVHPYQPCDTVQGSLELLYELEMQLNDLTGMDAYTFQPAAGAHGELTGILLIKAYHDERGDTKRDTIIVPDAAHGTNPATAAMVGYKVREVKSNEHGLVDLDALAEALGDDVAGLMLTNPNTLGLFDCNIDKITEMVHDAGGLCYYDGANLNPIMMQARPGDMGFDCVHLNVHKSLSTPHGGGGPGAGPVGCKDFLKKYLPRPVVVKEDDGFTLDYDMPESMGKVRSFIGSFGVLVRTYAYMLRNGVEGLKEVSEGAVANARYLMERVKEYYELPYDEPCMHEFVITSAWQKEKYGIDTNDIAKRLIDYGFHPPTVYFPLIVHEAMMVEPTETETWRDLDALAQAFIDIAKECETDPELVKGAPHGTPIARPDETRAAKDQILTCLD